MKGLQNKSNILDYIANENQTDLQKLIFVQGKFELNSGLLLIIEELEELKYVDSCIQATNIRVNPSFDVASLESKLRSVKRKMLEEQTELRAIYSEHKYRDDSPVLKQISVKKLSWYLIENKKETFTALILHTIQLILYYSEV